MDDIDVAQDDPNLTEEQKVENERRMREVMASMEDERDEEDFNPMEMTMKNMNLKLNLKEDDLAAVNDGDGDGDGKGEDGKGEDGTDEDGFKSDNGDDKDGSWDLGTGGGDIFNTDGDSDTMSSGWGDDGVDTAGWGGSTDLKSLEERYGKEALEPPPAKKFVPDERRLKAVKAMIAARDGKEGGEECRSSLFVRRRRSRLSHSSFMSFSPTASLHQQ